MTARRGHGEGSIHQRADGRWAAAIDLGWVGGRRRRKYLYGKTRREVADKLKAGLASTQHEVPTDERRTTAQYLDWWTREVLPGTVKRSTELSYARIVRDYVSPYVGRVRLTRLGPEHVQSMLRQLEAQGLSRRTQQYARAVLRRALRHAEKWGMVTRNAAALVDAPRSSPPKIDDALTLSEAKVLLESARGDRLEALLVVTMTMGLRKGEVLGLTWETVDLDAGNLTIASTLNRVDGEGLVLGEPKTARSRRVLPLPAVSLQALRAHRARQREERMSAASWQDSAFVFTTPIGTPLDGRNVTRWFHKLCEDSGIPRRRFHALRHSAATLMLAEGVPLEVISRTLGHAGYAITADVYAHVGHEGLRAGAAAMDRALVG